MSSLSFEEAHDWARRNPQAINWSTMLQDITRQAGRDGWQPTERQDEAYRRLVGSQMLRQAERSARKVQEERELASAPTLQSGRQQVTGQFVSCKYRSSAYGETLKGLFKCQDGNKLWLTVPAAVTREGDIDTIKSLTIAMSVDITAKEPHFGFGNRPTQVSVTNKPEHDHDADAAAYEAERINERAQEDSNNPDEDLSQHADYSAAPIEADLGMGRQPIGQSLPDYAAHVQASKLNVLWSERNGTVHNESLTPEEAREWLASLRVVEPCSDKAAAYARVARANAIQVALLRAGLSITA